VAGEYILPKFINNTIYAEKLIAAVIQIALSIVFTDVDKIPLTVVSQFYDVPESLGEYYPPNRENMPDWISREEFEFARNGIVRLKLDFSIDAKQFLTEAVYQYTCTTRRGEERGEITGIEDPMSVDAARRAEYGQAMQLVATACYEDQVMLTLEDLDNELGWIF